MSNDKFAQTPNKLCRASIAFTAVVILVAAAICLAALVPLPRAVPAEAAMIDGGSEVKNGEINDYSRDVVVTGASVSLKGSDSVTASAGRDATATVSITRQATITFGDKIKKALSTGKLAVKVVVSGTHVVTVDSGKLGDGSDSTYEIFGEFVGSGSLSEAAAFTDASEESEGTEQSNGNINKTFTDVELDVTSGVAGYGSFSFTYTVKYVAISEAASAEQATASISVDSTVAINVKLEFAEGAVTVTAQGGGSVSTGDDVLISDSDTERTKSCKIAFNDPLAFKAEASAGYYFAGWRLSSQDIRSDKTATFGTTEEPIEYGYQIADDISVTAIFHKIELDGAGESYVYDALETGVGPRVKASLGNSYDVVDIYSGTTNAGVQVDGVTGKPRQAGSYTHKGYMYYKGTAEEDRSDETLVGYIETAYVIERNVPTVTRADGNLTEITINYGGTLGDIDLTCTATNSLNAGEKVNGTVSVLLNGVVADRTKLLPADAKGVDYVIRFTPEDGYNYAVADMKVKIYVPDYFKLSVINGDDALRTAKIIKSETSTVDASVPNNKGETALTREVVKISLRATMTDDSGRYFFIGWRIGLPDSDSTHYTYLTAGAENGLAYDYYIPSVGDVMGTDADGNTTYYTQEDIERYTRAEFVAVFVRDTTAGDSDEISVAYTGGSLTKQATFSPENAGYGFAPTGVEYYDANDVLLTSAPSAIGTYKIKYSVRNTELGEVVGNREIKYVIAKAAVNATINTVRSEGDGSYNREIGWAKRMYYTVSVTNVLSGAISKYYYKTGDGEWTEIEGDIAKRTGCAITFVSPESATSYVSTFVFKAEDANGNVVAETVGDGAECKIDVSTPEIKEVRVSDSSGNTYSGGWQNTYVRYALDVTYGGSGAVISVKYGDTGSWKTLSLTDIGYSSGKEVAIVSRTVTFDIGDEFNGNVYVKIGNGVGVENESRTVFSVSIDKTPAVLGSGTRNKNLNANGWIGEETIISFDISDVGGSGISKVVCDTATVGGADGKYYLTVKNSAQHKVYVYDGAGNYSENTYYAPVDTDDLTYETAEGSFVADTWANTAVTVKFNAEAGASGVRINYSTDGESYFPCNEGNTFDYGNVTGAEVRTVTLSYTINVPDGEYHYYFRIENGAGIVKYIDYGNVKIDSVAPEFSDVTDLSVYQGEQWISSTINAEFRVAETSTVNSGIKKVTSDNSGVLTREENGKYVLNIDKCTPYTVTATDNAGNVRTYVFQANVDIVSPKLEIKAYVGGGNPEDPTVVPSDDDNDDKYAYDFASWINAAAKSNEPWLRIEFTITLTASGSAIEISNDGGSTWIMLTETYRPQGDEVSGTVSTRTYITQEQNKSYKFRLATGSGKYVEFNPIADGTAYVRIDFTAPTLADSQYTSGTDGDFPAEERWTSEDAVWKFRLSDRTTGSDINAETIALYKFSADISDESIWSDPTSGEKLTVTKSGPYYTYTFTDYNKYYLTFADNAGNVFEGKLFAPMVDKTRGFILDVTAKTIGADNVESEYAEDEWLDKESYVKFTGTPKFGSEYTAFGASGGYLELSVDDGATWARSIWLDGKELVVDNSDGVFTFAADADQNVTYKFRLVTGAGIESVYDGKFVVKRDGVTPEITATARTSAGTYEGAWTSEDVEIVITATYGMAGGKIQVSSGAEWTDLFAISPNSSAIGMAYTYAREDSQNLTYSFRYVGANRAEASSEAVAIKIDKTPVTATVSVADGNNAEVANGGWTYDKAIFTVNGVTGESGIGKVYVSYAQNGDYTDYAEFTAENDVYTVTFKTDEQTDYRTYKFKVVSNSGMSAETSPYAVGIDNAEAEFTATFSGEKASGIVYSEWYVSEIEVGFNIEETASGHKLYYKYEDKSDGTFASSSSDEWTEIDQETLYIGRNADGTPDNVAGGRDRRYSFKSVTGAGKEYVFAGEGEGYSYLPYDLYSYSASIVSYVGDKELDMTVGFANTVSGSASNLKRGDSVNFTYVSNTGYYLKEQEISGVNEVTVGGKTYNAGIAVTRKKADKAYVNIQTSVYVGGKDVVLTVRLYKEIAPKYTSDTTTQYLQSGSIEALNVVVDETIFIDEKAQTFAEYFGSIGFGNSYDIPLNATYTLSGSSETSSAVPQKMGQYKVEIDTDTDFIISASCATAELKVLYFQGSGTSSDPYKVYSESDFAYIDAYMNNDASYDYIGSNRRKAYFLQANDIVYDKNFKPMGGEGSVFSGTYDGNGYKIGPSTTATRAVKGDFGLFLSIENAVIKNVGVEFNVNHIGSDNVNIGLIAANATGSAVRECYAIGSITVKGSVGNVKEVCVGGIVGKMSGKTLVSSSFADVTTNIAYARGYVGGIAGNMEASYTSSVYVVSEIAVTSSVKYSPAADGVLYVGAIAGYASNLDGLTLPSEGNESVYLDMNLSFDGSIESGASLGNGSTLGEKDALRHKASDIDGFASVNGAYASEKIYNVKDDVETRSKTVRELTYVRIDRVKESEKVDGNGTSDDPFKVDSKDKLDLIGIFPWAHFEQTCDIEVGETEGYANAVPFVGVYDGGNHELRGVIINKTIDKDGVSYGGLFGVVGGTVRNLKVVDAEYTYKANGSVYIGGLAGYLANGGKIEDVVISGVLKADGESDAIFVGGLVGRQVGAKVVGAVTLIGVEVNGGSATVGGITGHMSGVSSVSESVTMSAVSIETEHRTDAGVAIGAIVGAGSEVSVGYLAASCFIGGKLLVAPVGVPGENAVTSVVYTYANLTDASADIRVNGRAVKAIIEGMYPFASGTGTESDPFIVSNYKELLLVGNYMYAAFKLDNDITVGDYDGDGKVDSDYAYDFAPIGGVVAFTGRFVGNGKTIYGLTDSLFYANEGRIDKLNLAMDYKLYAREEDIPESERFTTADGRTIYRSKVADRGQDVLLGAVAKINREGGSIIRVTVTGDVSVRVSGAARATVGGIVGLDVGGNIVGCTNSCDTFVVRASYAEVGGIVGSVSGTGKAMSAMGSNVVMTEVIDVGAGTAHAGAFVGAVKVDSGYTPEYNTDATVVVNGVDNGSVYVGYEVK